MKPKITRIQEIDDQIKKLMKDAADKLIDKEASVKKISELQKELRMLMMDIRSKK